MDSPHLFCVSSRFILKLKTRFVNSRQIYLLSKKGSPRVQWYPRGVVHYLKKNDCLISFDRMNVANRNRHNAIEPDAVCGISKTGIWIFLCRHPF
jgi:hypothetical protein